MTEIYVVEPTGVVIMAVFKTVSVNVVVRGGLGLSGGLQAHSVVTDSVTSSIISSFNIT